MEIPHSQLTDEVLEAIIEEFITREGTDYGDCVLELADKVVQVKEQLNRGDVFLSFDPLTQSSKGVACRIGRAKRDRGFVNNNCSDAMRRRRIRDTR